MTYQLINPTMSEFICGKHGVIIVNFNTLRISPKNINFHERMQEQSSPSELDKGKSNTESILSMEESKFKKNRVYFVSIILFIRYFLLHISLLLSYKFP